MVLIHKKNAPQKDEKRTIANTMEVTQKGLEMWISFTLATGEMYSPQVPI